MRYRFIAITASLVLSLISSGLAQTGQVLDTSTVRFEWTDPINTGGASDVSFVTLYGDNGATSPLAVVPHGAGFAEVPLPADGTWTFWTQSTYIDGSEDATQSNVLTNVVCNLEPPTGITINAVNIDARSTTFSMQWDPKGCANGWKHRVYTSQYGVQRLLLETRKNRVAFPLAIGPYTITMTSVNRHGEESAHSDATLVSVAGFDYLSAGTPVVNVQNALTTSASSFVLNWDFPANWNPAWHVVIWRLTGNQILPIAVHYRRSSRYHITNLPSGTHDVFITTRGPDIDESDPSSSVTFVVP